MKKIMFNDKYHLNDAVLEGRKSQTRRFAGSGYIYDSKNNTMYQGNLSEDLQKVIIEKYSRYKVGEVVAIAQRYSDFRMPNGDVSDRFYKLCCENYMPLECLSGEPGAKNKMFVKAELMPNHIKITNIRVEKLQDISDEDCIREGITPIYEAGTDNVMCYGLNNIDTKPMFDTPREAYAALIDKVSGKGTWDNNQYVFVYDFILC